MDKSNEKILNLKANYLRLENKFKEAKECIEYAQKLKVNSVGYFILSRIVGYDEKNPEEGK